MFTKLFSSITDSTIWRESNHVRLVWITMLAKSDASGFVWASVPGLADSARVEINLCLEALEKLKGPDEWSRSKEHEGRRIEEVDGGWRLLNYDKYKKIRNAEERREYVRQKVAEYRRNVNNVNNVNKSKHKQKQRIRSSEAESFKTIDGHLIKNDISIRILNYLNEKTGKNFQAVNGSLKFIKARLKEGATEEQCRSVIDLKCSSWLKDLKMEPFLRPQTLFNSEKFSAYVGEINKKQPEITKQPFNHSWEFK